MRRRLITRGNIKTDFVSTGDGGFAIDSHADIQGLLDNNHRVFDHDRMARRKSEFRHVAEIDPVTFLGWLREEGMTLRDIGNATELSKFLRKKLNDPDNSKFRVGPERL